MNDPTRTDLGDVLRGFRWLRDDGDGERLHMHREPLAENDEERCGGFYQRRCLYRKGHLGPHREDDR